jgi:hypothetical protein
MLITSPRRRLAITLQGLSAEVEVTLALLGRWNRIETFEGNQLVQEAVITITSAREQVGDLGIGKDPLSLCGTSPVPLIGAMRGHRRGRHNDDNTRAVSVSRVRDDGYLAHNARLDGPLRNCDEPRPCRLRFLDPNHGARCAPSGIGDAEDQDPTLNGQGS